MRTGRHQCGTRAGGPHKRLVTPAAGWAGPSRMIQPVDTTGVTGVVPTVAMWTAVGVAAVLGVVAGIGRRPERLPMLLAGVVELAYLGYVVAAIVQWVGDSGPDRPLVFTIYLVATAGVLPVAALWARAEKSRWSIVVLAITCLMVAVLVLRMQQIWSGV